MVEEKTEKKERECIVTAYGGSYYDGNAGYHSDFSRAKIYKESEIPDYIKRDKSEKIIFLDTKEGLELLVKEFEKNQRFGKVYKPKLRDAKENMKSLYKFESVRKYIELHNKWNHPLIGISHETENKIIEEIVSETANSN